jgi:hypothetical protein
MRGGALIQKGITFAAAVPIAACVPCKVNKTDDEFIHTKGQFFSDD